VRTIRTRPAAALLALLIAMIALLTACGGSDTASQAGGSGIGAAGTEGRAADAFPATSIFYGSVNIDPGSDGWKKMIEVGSRFPGWTKLMSEFNAGLNDDDMSGGIDFQKDIRPWLGGELAVAVTTLRITGGEPTPNFVAFAETTDDAKVEEALAKDGDAKADGEYQGFKLFTDAKPPAQGEEPIFAAVGENALLIANESATLRTSIDTLKGTGDSLSDADGFADTLAHLPSDNMAVGYLDGAQLSQLLQLAATAATQQGVEQAQQAAALQQQLDTLKAVNGIAFSAGFEDGGARMRGVATIDADRADEFGVTASYSPQIGSRVPADAVAYIAFRDLGPTLQRTIDQVLASQPEAAQQLRQAEQMLGLSIKDDLVPMLSGEHAIYVAPSPENAQVRGALLLQPDDVDASVKAVKQLTALAGAQLQTPFKDAADGNGQSLETSGQTVLWRSADDTLAFAVNDAEAGDERGDGITSDEGYKSAVDAAGMPDEVGALVYLDIPGIVELADAAGGDAASAAAGEGVVDEARANLAKLGGIVAWQSYEDGVASGDVFIEVKK
jgi:Protein of unknown function (DUF3352)